ncbi:MAG: TetR/AcrR family transcriptional regulator [Mangrovibacterium sp.]
MDPETRIIEAANKVFLKYGVDGTTMSQIADEANISRTSLHYYFRNKAHLFQKVLESVQGRVIPTLSKIINAEMPVFSKIEMFVNEYTDLIMDNPMIPGFLFMEMQREAKWIINLLKNQIQDLNFEKLNIQIEKEIAEGKINPFKLEDLYANIIGMSVFPLLSKPIFMEFIFNHNEEKFYDFMISRKKDVMSVIENWLKPC